MRLLNNLLCTWLDLMALDLVCFYTSDFETRMPKWLLALRLTGVGFFIAISIVLGIVGGLWLDRVLNTTPVFAIIGLLVGIAVAGYGVYQMLLPLLGNRRNKENS